MTQTKMHEWIDYIIKKPLWIWVLVGSSFSFFAFFVYPVFLNPQHIMQIFGYIPYKDPIGHDLALTTSFSETWFLKHQTPYNGLNLYPPLTMLAYAPLVFVKPTLAYKLFTLLNLAVFFLLCGWMPYRINKGKDIAPLLVFFFMSGLLSYGFQFELERGQYNLLTFFLCLVAIYLFHSHPRWRWLAYVLFTLSIHFKLYPAIFVLMLIDDWRDWIAIIKRIGILLVMNFVALFVLGPQIVWDFVNSVKLLGADSSFFIWIGNHSIRSFTESALPKILEAYHRQVPPAAALSMLQWVLLGMVLFCLLLMVILAYRRNTPEFNRYLFMACTLSALVIPSISHDYTLSLLPATMCIFLPAVDPQQEQSRLRKGATLLLVVIMSAAYTTTLFSFTNKPVLWQNNLPVLMIMLITCVLLYGISKNRSTRMNKCVS